MKSPKRKKKKRLAIISYLVSNSPKPSRLGSLSRTRVRRSRLSEFRKLIPSRITYCLDRHIGRGEFQFALKSQNEFNGGSLSRTRVQKSRLSESGGLKKWKGGGPLMKVEDDLKSDVVDVTSDEEGGNKRHIVAVQSQRRESGLVNGNGSENDTAMLKVPTKLKELLQTGYLEGLSFKYVHKGYMFDGTIPSYGLLIMF